jgi:uncharacterized protein
MRVVSDTSPLSNLAIIGRLDFLKLRYGEIRIPEAVARELEVLSHNDARKALDAAASAGWLTVDRGLVQPLPLLERASLDLGEAAAIGLALTIKADLLLIDEKNGRHVARSSGLLVSGVLGELLHAKNSQWISAVRPEIMRLRTEARFFMSREIEEFVLKAADE